MNKREYKECTLIPFKTMAGRKLYEVYSPSNKFIGKMDTLKNCKWWIDILIKENRLPA